ncbi:DNA polymerase III subunit gamma/tau [Anthocerotibacter panamensis]|uniref:DNA polymerase III subunit gamma/tau n=1 Tax=Anthocerotibacter panamensis TaxID=2857077 RepID=UPI001C4015CF|nr:DNA polymerase III subunit gamma/tau [Anthocerotibacter panamensis]
MYQPLFLKYRPQTFAQLVGQDPIVATLSNALRTNRLAHAYLLTGSRGTGKTSTARILAKSVNCETGITPEPCGRCSLCTSITRGSALDVIEIDAASNTGVDNIREIIERAQLAPAQARYKVYVIDECHMLSSAAFNALLKTLEEPPQRVIFILATTDPQRVLPTIISRCQRFDFRRIPLEAMTRHLAQIAATEGIHITAEAVELVAQVAQGGLRDAQSLLDQLGLLEGEVQVEQVWDLVGAVPERDLLALLEAIQTQDPRQVIAQTRRLIDRGREPIQVLQDLVGFLRDMLLAKVAPNEREWVALTRPTWEKLVAWGPSLDQSWLLGLQSTLRQAESLIKNSTQPRLWLEVTLLDLTQTPTCAPTPQPTLEVPRLPALPAPPAALPPPTEQTPRPIASGAQPEEPHDEPLRPTRTGAHLRLVQPVANPKSDSGAAIGLSTERLPELLKTMKNPMGRGLMGHAVILRQHQGKIVFGLPNKTLVTKLREPRLEQDIRVAVEALVGKQFEIIFEVGTTPFEARLPSPSQKSPSGEALVSTLEPSAVNPSSALNIATPGAPPVARAASAPPTSQPPVIPKGAEDQELEFAAKSVAEMFNGKVITDQQTAFQSPELAQQVEEDDF